MLLLPAVGGDQMRAIARAIDAHFTFRPAVDRADFLTFGRAIPLDAASFANWTDCFSRQFFSGVVVAVRREIPEFGAVRANSLCEPEEWRKKIMHARMTVGDVVLMGSDAPPDHYQAPQGFSLSIGTKDPAEAERIFNELAQNGKVQMPLQKTFWAVRFGMVVDRFGIPWMVNCEQAAA